MPIKKGYTIVKRNATNSELQAAIEAAIPQAVAQTKSIASRYKGSNEAETCKKIFDYLKNNINYIQHSEKLKTLKNNKRTLNINI